MAINVTTTIDGLADAITQELTMYSDRVNDGIRKQTKKSMRQLVKETKGTAPVGHRRKHYRDSITSKVTNKCEGIGLPTFASVEQRTRSQGWRKISRYAVYHQSIRICPERLRKSNRGGG